MSSPEAKGSNPNISNRDLGKLATQYLEKVVDNYNERKELEVVEEAIIRGETMIIDTGLISDEDSLRISCIGGRSFTVMREQGQLIALGLQENARSFERVLANGGDRFTVGRNPDNDLVMADQRVSGSHLEVYLEDSGELVVKDSSTNGTKIELSSDPNKIIDNSDASWHYTIGITPGARARINGEIVNHKKVRPTIGRDAMIKGGAFEMFNSNREISESIIVDNKMRPEAYNRALKLVRELVQSVDSRTGVRKINRNGIIRAIYDVVDETMKYDLDAVEKVSSLMEQHGVTEVPLNYFVDKGFGVCRHQALFAAQMIEEFIDAGHLRGAVSVDRNIVRMEGDKYGGHAWVRYTTSAGTVYIIDVAQHRLARLDDLVEERRHDKGVWDYERPEEKQARVIAEKGEVSVLSNRFKNPSVASST